MLTRVYFKKKFFFLLLKFHQYIYSIFPFILLLISNVLLLYVTVYEKSGTLVRSAHDKAKRRSLNISVIALTVSFFIFTAPQSISSGFYYEELRKTYIGNALILFFFVWRFTLHCSSFLVLMLTNTKFRNECKKFFIFKRNNRIATVINPNITLRTSNTRRTN